MSAMDWACRVCGALPGERCRDVRPIVHQYDRGAEVERANPHPLRGASERALGHPPGWGERMGAYERTMDPLLPPLQAGPALPPVREAGDALKAGQAFLRARFGRTW